MIMWVWSDVICLLSSWCCCNCECIVHQSVMFHRSICVISSSSAVSAGRRWLMQWWWSSWSSSPGVSWPHQCWQSVISLSRFIVIVHWTGTEYHLQSVGRIEEHKTSVDPYVYLHLASLSVSLLPAGVKVFLVCRSRSVQVIAACFPALFSDVFFIAGPAWNIPTAHVSHERPHSGRQGEQFYRCVSFACDCSDNVWP